ncbi:hypothetical protein M9Y10_026110 [Tritrichomonas musculus]|uniref:DUF3447 domain-containing protein n=1 Tax=Tritrichomonas musculus TaxID=1915356 RepID=A0ABR2H8G3_9EUKA
MEINLPSSSFTRKLSNKCNPNISLLSSKFNIFDFLPRLFKITTNTGSSKFNIDILQNTSSVISGFLSTNPEQKEYHLDIDDNQNVLGKFEKMYQGECVTFEEDELPISQKITKLLNIIKCPNYLKPESLKTSEFSYSNYETGTFFEVVIDKLSLDNFLSKNLSLQTFTITTNKKEYKCNIFGVYSSAVIRNLLLEDPTIESYVYNFDDEFCEFQPICDLFNFNIVNLTRNNMDSIKEIAEELQIELIIESVDNYINTSEKVSEKIDDQQTIIDSIDDLFNLLYNIKENTVEKVTHTIVDSEWSQTADKVKELAAFIIQAVKTDFLLHHYLIELIIQLDKESNETNKLEILSKFIVDQLLDIAFGNLYEKEKIVTLNVTIFAFIFLLYKREIIEKDVLYDKLKSIPFGFSGRSMINDANFKLWFLPELLETEPSSSFSSSMNISHPSNEQEKYVNDVEAFIQQYIDNIDEYRKMRDSYEPVDELTKALRNDDIEKAQSILSEAGSIDFKKAYIPFNMFESYVINGGTNYINYAAAYGSIKCFKYLFLNHMKPTKGTFAHAVYGGNIEIIKIVDQYEKENPILERDQIEFDNMMNFNHNDNLVENFKVKRIVPAIQKHRNDLFDWIFEQNFENENQNSQSFSDLFKYSIKNGNAHAAIELIDRGFNISEKRFIKANPLVVTSSNGFCLLTSLLINIVSNNQLESLDDSIMNYDNVSLFKLFVDSMKKRDLGNCLLYSIRNNKISIMKFFFSKEFHRPLNLNSSFALDILKASLEEETNKNFCYLFDQIKSINPLVFDNKFPFDQILNDACTNKNFDACKTISDLIIEKKISIDFTLFFVKAAESCSSDICEYFVEKEFPINYEKLSSFAFQMCLISVKLFSLIYDEVSPEGKEKLLCCLSYAVCNNNKDLVKFLLKKTSLYESALIDAVGTSDLELVDIILKENNEPSFINNIYNGKTALYSAVYNNNLPIVKRLLSVPGINPSKYFMLDKTALFQAYSDSRIEIFDEIINFYIENDKKQELKLQFTAILKNIIHPDNNHNDLFRIMNPQPLSKSEEIKKERRKKIANKYMEHILNTKCFDPNVLFEETPLTYSIKCNRIDFVQKLLDIDELDVNMYNSTDGDTPFICAVKNNNIEIVKLLINHPKIDINLKNFNNETGLTISVSKNFITIIDIMIHSEKFKPAESLLNYAFFISKGEASKLLSSLETLDVNQEIDVHSVDKDIFIPNKPKQENRIRKVLRQGPEHGTGYGRERKYGIDNPGPLTFIPFRIPNETALINAIDLGDIEKVDLIINHSSFDKVKSQLKTAFFFAVEARENDIIRKLSKISDEYPNIIDGNGKSLLYYCIYCSNYEIIDEILNDPNFDSEKSDILSCFVISYTHIHDNDQNGNNPNNHNNRFNTPDINNVVHQFLLNNQVNPPNFNNQNNLLNQFNLPNPNDQFNPNNQNIQFNPNSLNILFNPNDQNIQFNQRNLNNGNDEDESLIQVMNKLYEYDKEHDNLIDFSKLLPSGKSFLTAFQSNTGSEEEAINFLLDHGCDPDEPDKYNVFPLQNAINSKLIGVINALVDSDKIDLQKQIPLLNDNEKDSSAKPKYTTYLHIAASIPEPSVLQALLSKKKFDVNATDELGDTPLITACKHKRKRNINSLLCINELDCFHCNKDGKDALSILDPLAPKTKDLIKYRSMLIKLNAPSFSADLSNGKKLTHSKKMFQINEGDSDSDESDDSTDDFEKKKGEKLTEFNERERINMFHKNILNLLDTNKQKSKDSPSLDKDKQNETKSFPLDSNKPSSETTSAFSFNFSKQKNIEALLPHSSNKESNSSASSSESRKQNDTKAFSFDPNKENVSNTNTFSFGLNKPNNESASSSEPHKQGSVDALSLDKSNQNDTQAFSFDPNKKDVSNANTFSFGLNKQSNESASLSESHKQNGNDAFSLGKSNQNDTKAFSFDPNKENLSNTNTFLFGLNKPNNESASLSESHKQNDNDAFSLGKSNQNDTNAFSFDPNKNDASNTNAFSFGLNKPNNESASSSESHKHGRMNAFSLGKIIQSQPKAFSNTNTFSNASSSESRKPGSTNTFSFVSKEKLSCPSSLTNFNFETSPAEPVSNLVKPKAKREHKNVHKSNQSFQSQIEAAVTDVFNDADEEEIRILSKSLSRIVSRRASQKANKIAEIYIEDDEYDEDLPVSPYPPFSPFDQNLFMMQQQQQWLQMIEMSNARQAQLNMQMMCQNQKMHQTKKKRKQKNRKIEKANH